MYSIIVSMKKKTPTDKERKAYTTTLRTDLMKELKLLAVEMDKRHNDLIEEAIISFLKKHKKR
jgi:hypothetical protein